jgi:F-type H+-transporting ATPase subunit a
MKLSAWVWTIGLAVAPPGGGALRAQEAGATPAVRADSAKAEATAPARAPDFITPHITDSHELEIPFYGEYQLPRWEPVRIGGLSLDLSPTKHVVMLLISSSLITLILILAARAHVRGTSATGSPRGGLANAIEGMVLYMRNEVILPNVGPHGDGFVPLLLTIFFFVLAANLLGLVPYGATATGNISVTATLALITFITVEISGMRSMGKGYIATIVYWPHDMPFLMKAGMTLVMTPVEIIGKFTKPFALAIRLFANMTAGHVVMLAMISLIFTFGFFIVPVSVAMGVAISMLELFVAFLQAFIFTLLSSVFIGLMRSGAH